MIFPVNGLRTFEDSLSFVWKQTSAAHSYTLFLYDGTGKEIISKPEKDTQAIISTVALQLQNGKYYWLIKGENGSCEDGRPLYFELMTKDEEAKLIDLLITNNSEDLSNQLQIIDKLEKNGLIYVASNYYANAVKANSGDEFLARSYTLFLLQYGFDDEALKVWNSIEKK